MHRRFLSGLIFTSLSLSGVVSLMSTPQTALAGVSRRQDADGSRAALIAKFKRIGDLFNQGQAAMAKSDYKQAETAFSSAYDVAKETGDRVSIGVMLDALGNVYTARGDIDQALEAHGKAADFLRDGDDRAAFGRCLMNLAVTYQAGGQTNKAIQFAQESVTLWHSLNNVSAEAASLLALGDYQKDAGRFEAAIATLRQSLAIRESINAGAKAIAECHNDIGLVFIEAARFEEARQEFETGLFTAQETNDTGITAGLLGSLGAVEADEGHFKDAMDYERRALALREKGSDPEAIARSVGNIAAVCYQCGRFDQALLYGRRALSIAEGIGSKQLQASELTNLGITYDAMGQRAKATESLLRAVDLCEQTGNQDAEANTIFNLGFVSLGMHDYKAAITFFERALPVAEKKGDAAWTADVESAIGMAEDESGHPEAALPMFEKADAYWKATGRRQEIARSLNSLGAVYRSLRRFDDAAAAFTRSVEINKQIGNPLSLAIVQTNLASIYAEQQQWEKSAPLLQAAIASAETVRDQVGSPSDIGALQQNNTRDIYNRYASVLLHLGRADDALCAVESGRGQGLARQAVQSRSDWKGILSPTDGQRLGDAVEALRSAETTVQSVEKETNRTFAFAEPADGQAAGNKMDEARRVRDEAQLALSQLRDGIAARDPKYRAICGLDKPSIEQFTKLAKDHPDTLFLSWSPTNGDETLLFALRGDAGLKAYSLPIGHRQLAQLVGEWRAAILPSQLGGLGADSATEHALARRLYDSLFAAVEKDGLLTAAKTKRLVVIGDGTIRDIPFAALLDTGNKRLIEHYPLSTGVSLRLLATSGDGAGASRPVGKGILCMADPAGDDSHKAEDELFGSAALPASRLEGKAIAALYGDGATSLIGNAATREAILSYLSTARLLHFSTHGYLDDAEGLHSGLLIAPSAQKPNEDMAEADDMPLLTGEEILEHPLAAELTTLSACETGQGSRNGGDGLLGLVWAFHAAGCPSVIASQWSVADGSTAVLMVEFYRGLRSGMRRDEALQKAMLALIHQNDTRLTAPFFWAAFQLSGEAGPLGIPAAHQ